MVEISQIPATSKLKELRGQINAMVNNINYGQMFIGQVLNPKAHIFHNGEEVGSVASWFRNQLFAICLPAANGVYVAQVFGCLLSVPNVSVGTNDITSVVIDIPEVWVPDKRDIVNAFVIPQSVGFETSDPNVTANTGLQLGLQTEDSDGTIAVITDTALNSSSTAILLNYQNLVVDPGNDTLTVDLSRVNYGPQS